jgi:hypothetical protein
MTLVDIENTFLVNFTSTDYSVSAVVTTPQGYQSNITVTPVTNYVENGMQCMLITVALPTAGIS